MVEAITGGLLILSFAVFIYYAMKGGNLTVGFFIMAVLWVVIGRIPLPVAIDKVFTQPVLDYGKTAATIIFGSWFGRVLVETGIASSITRRTEVVGKKSPVLATILIALVTFLIFSGAYGVGSAIAVGVILFPIMFSMGVPRRLAVSVFTLSIGAAMYINNVLFVQFQVFFKGVEWGNEYLKFGIPAAIIQMTVVIIFILINSKKIRNGKPELVAETEETDTKEVSPITYVLPIVPVTLSILLKWNSIPALILATLLAMLMTGQMKTYVRFVKVMNDTVKQAVSDIAGLLIMLFVLTMFQQAAVLSMSGFTGFFKAIIPTNHLVLILIMMVIAPLSYFRGPLMLYGAGAATASIFVATGLFPPYFLYGLLVVPTMMAVSADITQSWNLWSVEYAKLDTKTFLKTGLPWAWLATALNLLLVFYMYH
ncbi:transporter permease [Pediococcus argentinicus]|nr:hypothetical protein [Pediococcus argentinicus]NKZ22561.1 gluconate:proton symporter [Pediococcus argentinicus]GEP19601.1 citrate transporter [Pediococcus argentinicus]